LNHQNNDLLRIDLHVHTAYSYDGFTTIEQLSAVCQRRGISGLAITDHDTLEAALLCKKSLPLQVIVGEEVTTACGHLIGLFLTHWIPPGLSVAETIDRIRDQGGLVYLPHPFDRVRSGYMSPTQLQELAGRFDMVEVFNSRNLFPDANHKAATFAESHSLLCTVGSDAHIPHEVGRSTLQMKAFSGPEEFLVNLKQAQLTARRTPLAVRALIKLRKRFAGIS
jgi:predicted metal-dependent phosphoesterase TrpH